jgi:hypothetical protein
LIHRSSFLSRLLFRLNGLGLPSLYHILLALARPGRSALLCSGRLEAFPSFGRLRWPFFCGIIPFEKQK